MHESNCIDVHIFVLSLLYKRDCLIKEMTDTLKNFDYELLCLRHEKFLMDIDMKMADLRFTDSTRIH